MKRVAIIYMGKRAWVDEDQVKKLAKKEELVITATQLQQYINADKVAHAYAEPLLQKKAAQIIRLNRTIRQNVVFAL